MKTILGSPRALALGSMAALTVALTTFSAHAGPGPQYWEKKRPAPTPVAQASEPTSTRCTGCKTEVVREYTGALPNGKGTPSVREVGTRHSCVGCATVTTTVRDKTSRSTRAAIAGCTPPPGGCCL